MSSSENYSKYQHEPTYWGKEDPTPLGRAAVAAAEKAISGGKGTLPLRGNKLKDSDMPAVNAAKSIVKEQDDLVDSLKDTGNPYKKGGKVKVPSRTSASKRADGIASKGHTKGRYL
jgi:hypothetical protein